MTFWEMIKELTEELCFSTRMDWIKTTTVLLVNAFLFSLSTLIGSAKFLSLTRLGFRVAGQSPETVFTAIFSAIFIGGLLVGWTHTLIMNVLGGTGTTLEGISVVAWSILPVSIGTLVASIAAYIPLVGPIVAYLLVFILGGLGYAILYRTTKEFFEVDMITAFVGISLLIAAGTGAFYASFLASTTDINAVLEFIRP